MLHDLRMAQRVQESIIPNDKNLPHIPGLEFSSKYLSMESVGGDLYDIIHVGENKCALLIADVSGHGVPAALITTMAKVAYHSHVRANSLPSDIHKKVHIDIFQFIGDLEYYLTAYLGILDLNTGIFQYSNGGHHPALLLRDTDKKLISLNTEGILIGAIEEAIFTTKSIQLYDGDRLILYTDGIIEARNPADDLFEFDRLTSYIFSHAHLSTKEFVNGMIQTVDKFSEGRAQDDDRAVLCVDYFTDKEKIAISGRILPQGESSIFRSPFE